MKQKLAVARALLHRPQLLFLDEPTSGLDPIAAAALRDDLTRLVANEGVTVFLPTHNLAEAEKLCAQVGVIRQGELLAVGSPDERRTQRSTPHVVVHARGVTEAVLAQLRAQPGVRSVDFRDGRLNLELQPGAELSPLVGLLVTSGVQVEEVRRGSASLEEAFLALVRESEEEEQA